MSIFSNIVGMFQNIDTVVTDIETDVKALNAAVSAISLLTEEAEGVAAEARVLLQDLQSMFLAYNNDRGQPTASVLKVKIAEVKAYLGSQESLVKSAYAKIRF